MIGKNELSEHELKVAFGTRIFRIFDARLTVVDEPKGYINYVSPTTGKMPKYAHLDYSKTTIEFLKKAIEDNASLNLLITRLRKGKLIDYLIIAERM